MSVMTQTTLTSTKLKNIMNDNFIDDFLATLENDKSKPRDDSARILKLTMSSRDNQGTILFAPFMDSDHKFYYTLPGTRELRTTISKYKDGNDEVWVKILDKSYYKDLTEEESALYDQVAGLFDQYEADCPGEKFNKVRYRTYSIFQGVVTSHVNSAKQELTDHAGRGALLIFPSKAPINALANAIQSQIDAMKNREWMTAIFAPTDKNRNGVILMSFVKAANIGYDASVQFQFNNTFTKVIDPVEGFPETITGLFKDPIGEFLGWQNGADRRFNADIFREVKQVLTLRLKALAAGSPESPAPAPVQVPGNNNGVDPMVGTPAPAPAPAPVPAASQGAEGVVPPVKLPF